MLERHHSRPKLDAFSDQLKTDPILKNHRTVVFTESKETGEYLFERINRQNPGRVMFFSSAGGGRSNIDYIEKRLKDKSFRTCKKFTDSDEDFISNVRQMIAHVLIAKKTAQTIKKACEKTLDPLELLAILRRHIRVTQQPEPNNPKTSHSQKREIVLSVYHVGGADEGGIQ